MGAFWVRSCINILNKHPEHAEEFFNQEWKQPAKVIYSSNRSGSVPEFGRCLRWSRMVENVSFEGIKFLLGKHRSFPGVRFQKFFSEISSSDIQVSFWRKFIPGTWKSPRRFSSELNYLSRWTPSQAGFIFLEFVFLGKLRFYSQKNERNLNKVWRMLFQN